MADLGLQRLVDAKVEQAAAFAASLNARRRISSELHVQDDQDGRDLPPREGKPALPRPCPIIERPA